MSDRHNVCSPMLHLPVRQCSRLNISLRELAELVIFGHGEMAHVSSSCVSGCCVGGVSRRRGLISVDRQVPRLIAVLVI